MPLNNTAKFAYRIRKEQRKADAAINAPAIKSTVAWLGDNNGVMNVLNGQTLPESYIVVRDYDGNLSSAWNPSVPALVNLRVNVGYDPLEPTRYRVLSISDYLTINPTTAIISHHKSHEWPGGDTTYIHSEQYLPGLLIGNAGLIVTILPFFFKQSTGNRGLVAQQTFDLTAYLPLTGAQAFTLVCNDAGVLSLLPGAVQISLALITVADFPINIDSTLHDLWGIRLYKGQAVVKQTATYSDVFDFRMGGIQGGGGGTGDGHVIQDEGISLTQRTKLNFVGPGVEATDDAGNDATIITVTASESFSPFLLMGG